MRSRLRAAIAVAVATVLLLAGCTGIPRDGGVGGGRPIAPGDNPAPVFLPSGPQEGASPEAILLGFIDAASSPENKYAVAREFLTPRFSAMWNPDAGVTVDAGSGRSTSEIDERTLQIAVTPIAEVSASGEYREVESPAPVPLRYRFAEVDGQWRISEAPNGIVIDQGTFSEVFSAQKLYYFDSSFGYLVPDLRWFPRGAAAPTRIVKALLAGPSPWLAPAVVTAFPAGTELTADAVQVVLRDAKVDLNSEALNADRVTMSRMRHQLLRSLPAGMTVTITVNQNSQVIADLGASTPAVNPRVDARPLVVRNGEFGFLTGTGEELTAVEGLNEQVAALNPLAVTTAAGQTSAAVLTANGVFAVRVGEDARMVDPRPGLIPPSIDSAGYIWSVPSARPGELVAYSSAGEAIPVPASWPDMTAIHSVKVSRDGTRLLAQLGSAAGSRLVVAGIVREDGIPVRIGEPLTLSSNPGTAVDATWVDELTVAAVTRLPGGEEQMLSHQIGGVTSPLEASSGVVAVAGGNTVREVRALTAGGSLQVQRGVGWQERIGGVLVLATQQGPSS